MRKYLFFIIGFVIVYAISFGCSTSHGDIKIGQRIYEDGVLSNGDLLQATGQGGILLKGKMISCAQCHRKSGFGSNEGSVYVPPIVAQFLFEDYQVERKDMIRSLFQEDYSLEDWAKIRQMEDRPAYNSESLNELVLSGRNNLGNNISETMPRYRISDIELNHLEAYLKTLNTEDPVGIQNDTIHFATIITDDVEHEKKKALIEIIEAYVNWKNRNVIAQNKAAEGPNFHRGAFRGTYLNWKVHYWSLEGASDTWYEQLEQKFIDQPIFSFVSGLSNHSWEPMHSFAEDNSIPSLFPNTRHPVYEEQAYNLYFTRGAIEEAKVTARYLNKSTHQIILISGEGSQQQLFKESLIQELSTDIKIIEFDVTSLNKKAIRSYLEILDENDSLHVILNESPEVITNQGLPFEYDDRVILYLNSSFVTMGNSDVEMFKRIYASPYQVRQLQSPRNHRIHAWMRSRGINTSQEILQLNTYFALSIADFALGHMVGNYSREYFIERIEHETENNLNPGIYARMSLGPGQRFAVRDIRLVGKSAYDLYAD